MRRSALILPLAAAIPPTLRFSPVQRFSDHVKFLKHDAFTAADKIKGVFCRDLVPPNRSAEPNVGVLVGLPFLIFDLSSSF